MRFRINRRDDLATLSDVELTERLSAAWQAYEASDCSWLTWQLSSKPPSLPSPRAYRLIALFNNSGAAGNWLELLVFALLSGKWAERFVRSSDPAIQRELALFEIGDLHREIEQRIEKPRRAS